MTFQPNKLPIIYVVAGVFKNNNGEFLIIKRPKNKVMSDLWEFPGGKIELGETPEVALVRELNEEIGLTPTKTKVLPFISHQYETFHIVLLPYLITEWHGTFQLIEQQQGYAWIKPNKMDQFDQPATSFKIMVDLIEMNAI